MLAEILDLALPFFGLVELGVAAARIWSVGDKGLEWLNIFLIWFALPALLLSQSAYAGACLRLYHCRDKSVTR